MHDCPLYHCTWSFKKRRQEGFPPVPCRPGWGPRARVFGECTWSPPLPRSPPGLPLSSRPRLPIGGTLRRRVQSQHFAPNLNRCFLLNREKAAGGVLRLRRQRSAPPGASWVGHPVSGEGDGGGSGACGSGGGGGGGGRGPAGCVPGSGARGGRWAQVDALRAPRRAGLGSRAQTSGGRPGGCAGDSARVSRGTSGAGAAETPPPSGCGVSAGTPGRRDDSRGGESWGRCEPEGAQEAARGGLGLPSCQTGRARGDGGLGG